MTSFFGVESPLHKVEVFDTKKKKKNYKIYIGMKEKHLVTGKNLDAIKGKSPLYKILLKI